MLARLLPALLVAVRVAAPNLALAAEPDLGQATGDTKRVSLTPGPASDRRLREIAEQIQAYEKLHPRKDVAGRVEDAIRLEDGTIGFLLCPSQGACDQFSNWMIVKGIRGANVGGDFYGEAWFIKIMRNAVLIAGRTRPAALYDANPQDLRKLYREQALLQAAAVTPTPTPLRLSAAPQADGADVIVPPTLLSRVEPHYSETARNARFEGVVVVEAVVTREGRVDNIRVTKSVNPLLDAAVVRAVSEWRYSPATKNGQPVAVYLFIKSTFRLDRRRQHD